MDELHEQGGGWLSWCKPEWEVIKGAPWSFGISVLSISVLVLIGLFWLFHENLQRKDDLIGSSRMERSG